MIGRGVLLLVLAVLAGAAQAADDPLAGRTLALRQGKTTARMLLVARTAVVAPLPGGSEDPKLRGASLEIGNPETGEWARLLAPASGWSVNPLGTVFRFRAAGRGASPGIRSFVIRHGRQLKVKASAIGITLDEKTQGVVAVALTTGTRRYCLVFGGEVRRDEPGKFAARTAPAPATCPVPAATAISTTTTITTTTSSSTTRPPEQRPTTSTTRTSTPPPTSSTSSTVPPGASTTLASPTTSSTSTSSTSSSTSAPAPTTSTSSSTSTTRDKPGKGPKK
jgi:hypothetical protein